MSTFSGKSRSSFVGILLKLQSGETRSNTHRNTPSLPAFVPLPVIVLAIIEYRNLYYD